MILDQFCAISGFHRKHAIRVLTTRAEVTTGPRVVLRVYDEAVREALVVLWEASDRLCSKRLRAMLPVLVDAVERRGHMRLVDDVRAKLLAVSPATIDRLLTNVRAEASMGRKRRRSKAGSISSKIEIRTFAGWKSPTPGKCEVDMVVHCGGSMSGSFVHTLVATDIATTWTDFVALVPLDQELVVEGLAWLHSSMPAGITGIDTDNDSAFINETVLAYCQARQVEQTRSRARRSNDQAWVEQKNGAVIRKLVGHGRYVGVPGATALGRLYRAARLFVNHFQPSAKIVAKHRQGSRVRREYDEPRTPLHRLLARADVGDDVKDRLRQLHDTLDPIELLREIRNAQAELASLADATAVVEHHDDVKVFLEALPEKWHRGEVRPTHRSSPRPSRTWRTREDPFAEVWPEVKGWLLAEPDVPAVELLRRLRLAHAGAFDNGQLRTLQRRVRLWRVEMARKLVGVGDADSRSDDGEAGP